MFLINKLRWFVTTVGLVGILMALPAVAAPPMEQPPKNKDTVHIVFHDSQVPIEILDQAGNPIGEGIHSGEAVCKKDNCNKKTQLDLPLLTGMVTFEYQFTTPLAVDPVAGRAILAGTGAIFSDGQKERFTVTATFQNNGNGTVSVTYSASSPDASFIVQNSPGTFEISG